MIPIELRHFTRACINRAKNAAQIEAYMDQAISRGEPITREQVSKRFLMSESALEMTLSAIDRDDLRHRVSKNPKKKKPTLPVATRIAVLKSIISENWDWSKVAEIHGESYGYWVSWYERTYPGTGWRKMRSNGRPDWDAYLRHNLELEIRTEVALGAAFGVELKCSQCAKVSVQSTSEDWESILG